MPELPEVETVMQGMTEPMLGDVVENVEVKRYDLRGGIPDDFRQVMTGCRIQSLERRGKYILIITDRDNAFVLHLGMSGRIRIFPSVKSYEARKHDHVIITMQGGSCIAFEDPRRFGMFYHLPLAQWDDYPPFNKMGPEPLSDWSGDDLYNAIKKRGTPIKNALLDQNIVAGLGNIYVCEALFRAGILPTRKASMVTKAEAQELNRHIKDILKEAIKSGGSTLKDYQHTDGSLGYFQHRFSVYDQEGHNCSHENCDTDIIRIVQSGRSSFYCPSCQT